MMASEPRVQWPAVLLLLFTLSWFLHIMSGQLTNSRNQHLVSRSANTHLHWPKERFFQADRITRHDMVVEDLQQQPWRQNQGRLVKNINDKSSDLADNKAVLSSQSFETVSMSAPSKASDRLLQLQDLATPPTSKTMQRFSFVPKLVHSGTSSPSSQAQSRSYVERWFEVFHYLPEVSRTQISSLRNKRLAKPRQVDAPSGILALPQTALTKFQQKSKRIPAVLERQEPQKKGIILSRYKLQNASKFRRLRITPLRFHRSKASMKRTQWLKVSTLVGGISTWRFDHGLNSAFHSLHIFDRARKVLHPVGLWLSKKGKLYTVENGVDFRTYHNNRPVRNQGCKNVTQTFPVVNNTNAIRSEINKKLEYDFKKAFLPHSSHKPIQRTSIEHLVRQDQQTSSNSTQLSSELNLLAVQDTNKLNSLDLGSNHKQEKDLSNRTLSRLKRSSKSNNEFTSRRRPASSSEKRSSGLPFRNRFPRPPGDRDSRFPNSRPGTGDRFSNFPGLGNGPGFQPPPLGPGLGTEPQPVSLKVIVHLGVRRGYQRYIDSAITKVTRRQEFLPLIPYIRPTGRLVTLANDNPRDILQAFCTNILEANSTAVFHLINPFHHTRSWSSAQYVANLLTTLNMPVITWGPEYIGTTDKKESDTLQLTISATLQHQVQAMLAVLRHYNWKHFGVVYTPVPGHDAFLTAIRILVNDNNSNTRHSGFKFDIVVQQELSNVSDAATMRRELRDLSMTEARILLLYCLESQTLEIIQAAGPAGLTGSEYLWFLTFEAINKNKLGRANNLPLGLMGVHYDYRDTEMRKAITTAVTIWLQGLRNSVLATMTSDGLPTGLPWGMPNLECNSSSTLTWQDGPSFYQFLMNVSYDDVSFNELGQLKSRDISIVNVQPSGNGPNQRKWTEVGDFTSDGVRMRHITWPGGSITPPSGKPKRHFLNIVTRREAPFVEYRPLQSNGTCGIFSSLCHVYPRDQNDVRLSNETEPHCCTGLSIDFLHKIAAQLNFDYYLYEVEDLQWGTQMADGNWDGIVGELREGRADMAVSSMTIDEDRSKAINFSVPYMETGITFIVAIREGAISATAFLEPYDYPSWCLILVCSVHVTGASIFLFEWFSPNGLDHGRKMNNNHRFSLFRTFWLMWAMLFGAAVTTDTPRGVSSKFMSSIWALFALVFSASYTANLAAFMITKEEYYDLAGMQDWRLQKPYAMSPPFSFATIPNGTTESNIRKNSPEMYSYMKQYRQRSVEEAMEALKNQKLHAFIYDASVLEYQEGKDKDCRLITVGNWYATTGYGVGFPFRSPWLDKVNEVILSLQFQGEMERLKEFWLAGACHTKRKKTSNSRGLGSGVSSATLGILNFTSAFIFLAAGTGLAAVTFILEHCYFWFGRKRLSAWDKKGCCALISLSMGMSLSFRDSVREAMDVHRRSRDRCQSPACETKLWKANHELKQARTEIGQLQEQLAQMSIQNPNVAVWRYDPETVDVIESQADEMAEWEGQAEASGSQSEEDAVRVTLL